MKTSHFCWQCGTDQVIEGISICEDCAEANLKEGQLALANARDLIEQSEYFLAKYKAWEVSK